MHADELKSLQEILPEVDEKMHFYTAKGCDLCNQSGYEGRLAVREVIEVKDDIRKLITNRANAQDIKVAAMRGGMTTMIRDSLIKASEGLTSIEEVLRVVNE